MRKIICFSLIFVFFLTTVPVFAQVASPSSAPRATVSVAPNAVFIKAVSQFMARVHAGVFRIEKISQRIVTRLTKIRVLQVNKSEDLAKVESQQKTFATQLEQLKNDLVQLDLASGMLATSSSVKKDYPVFKNQASLFIKNLKNVYILGLNLVSDMKQLATVAATPSVKLIPTQ